MGVGKLQGTPWHIETLKKDDDRRHKNWCIHYKNGYCDYYERDCNSSKNCDNYVDNENHETKHIINKGKYVTKNYYDKQYLQGKFTLEFEDGTRTRYTIWKDIDIDAPIMEKVLKSKFNDEFEFNGEKVKIINKKIRYNREASDIQNHYYNRILSDKPLDEQCINNTNVSNLKFKIKFLDDGKVMHYVAGKSIRWDDPLVKIIIELNNGTKFTYKSLELLLVSKYMYEKK